MDGMMSGGMGWGWMSVGGLLYLALAAFVGGLAFWFAYKLVMKKER